MPSRRVPIAGFVFVVLLFLLMVLTAKRPMPEEELERRVDECTPSWGNYDEDLKAQLGATPVAEWEGEPVRIAWDDGAVIVSFSLSGEWAERDFGIPVLIRLPAGTVVGNELVVRQGTDVSYVFATGLDAPPQWVVIRYPFYGERRIVLSEDGTWKAE